MKLSIPYKLSLCLSLTVLIIVVTGCATSRDSVLLGAGVGATAGAAIGYGTGESAQGAAVGGVIGAVTGGIFGYLANRAEQKKAPSTATVDAKKNAPLLNKPEVRMIWVPDKIEGDQFIQGHYMYIIDKQSSWRKD